MMGNLVKVLYPYADLTVRSQWGWNLFVVVNGVIIWDSKIDGRVHRENSMDFLSRLRRVV